jgi:hypothetical protein
MAQVLGAYGGNIMAGDTTISANQTLVSGQNYMSIGPITISSGVTVTINSGVDWVII